MKKEKEHVDSVLLYGSFPNTKQPVFTEHIFPHGIWRSGSLSGRLALG